MLSLDSLISIKIFLKRHRSQRDDVTILITTIKNDDSLPVSLNCFKIRLGGQFFLTMLVYSNNCFIEFSAFFFVNFSIIYRLPSARLSPGVCKYVHSWLLVRCARHTHTIFSNLGNVSFTAICLHQVSGLSASNYRSRRSSEPKQECSK